MLRNYLKIAFRNLLKNKIFSAINIFGLALGMATALLSVLFIKDEWNYDKFFSKADRIYQVNMSVIFGEMNGSTSNTPPPVGSTMQQEFPEIEAFTRVFYPYEIIVKTPKSNEQFVEAKVLAVDSNFLQIFDYEMLSGDAKNCLNDPNSVVITENIAKKYFGKQPALGEILLFNDKPVKVSGILKNIPTQASIRFEILKPMKSMRVVENFSWSWVWLQVDTYVLLKPNISAQNVASLNAKFPAMVKKHAVQAFKRIGQPFDEFIKKGGKWDFFIRPMQAVHLYSAGIDTRINTIGDIKQVYIFGAVAIFIVLLACVNFMNLATARSVKRAKEVGIQKALGAERNSLIGQFLGEAFIFSIIAGLVALLLFSVVLPFFNEISGKTLTFFSLFSNGIYLWFLGLILLVTLLAGSYPAFYLTSFNPVTVLKAQVIKTSSGSRLLRNGLVVFQFTVSIALIICTILIFSQIKYTQTKDLGFSRENTIVIPNVYGINNKETFRQEIAQQPGVIGATVSTDVPAGSSFGDFYVPEPANDKETVAKDVTLFSYMTDEYFIPTMQMKIEQGRNFSKEFITDSASVILNETAVRAIGWKNPIGQYLHYPGGGDVRFKVIGIIKDFNVQSLKMPITPFALFHYSSKMNNINSNYLLCRTQPGQEEKLLQKLGKEWMRFMPSVPFSYSFLDKNFEALYQSEQKTASVIGVFTTLSVFIACLGLFGLIAFSVEQRTKEIGIRKVLGASVSQIVTLISKDFLKLVLLGFVIASPIAWYAMNQWLQDFAYRIDISWWTFALAGILALLIALLTISFQAIKAALANPVKSLRTE